MKRISVNKPLRPNSSEVHTNDKNHRFEKYNLLKMRRSERREFKHKWIAMCRKRGISKEEALKDIEEFMKTKGNICK
jgi:hypothetical protein